MQDTFINLDWHVNCFYEDAEGARIVIHRFGGGEAIDLSPEPAQIIRAALGNNVESKDGFAEDPTATIYFRYPNQLGEHLNETEQRLVSAPNARYGYFWWLAEVGWETHLVLPWIPW